MEIRTLITFVRIAEVQNFSKAAEQLGYSQSAVTMQIKQLEEQLHTLLFERIGRQVKLTQAGERLLPYALEALHILQEAEGIGREPEEITGPLRIGTSESFVISILPGVFDEFQAICPHVEISVQTDLVSNLFQKLRQNEVDLLYFLDEQVYFPEWVKVFERPEPVHFAASARSPLAGEKRISLERLLQEPLYLTEKGISYRYAVEQALAARGVELHPFLEIGNTEVITRFLLKNRGISFLPDYVVRDYLAQGELVILDTECPEITVWSQLVYHRNKYVTPQMRAFMDLLVRRQTG
ncbi:MAG: LysR family transcriptional regulator [Oscillibacter sp.]|nr:LysR family transcriptional regulator [Oscillibacter sp.]